MRAEVGRSGTSTGCVELVGLEWRHLLSCRTGGALWRSANRVQRLARRSRSAQHADQLALRYGPRSSTTRSSVHLRGRDERYEADLSGDVGSRGKAVAASSRKLDREPIERVRCVLAAFQALLHRAHSTSTVRAFDTSHLQHGDKDEYGAPHMPKPSSFAPPLSPSLSGGPGAALDRLAGWAAKPLQRRSSAGGEAARQHRKRDSASQKIQAGLVSMGIGRDRRSSQTGEAAAKRASLAVMPIPDSSKSASALSLPVSAETNGLGLGFAPTDWHRGRTKSNGSSSRASASSGDDFDRRIAETVHSMTMSPAVGADEKARNQVELMELLSRPENRSCADCGRAGALNFPLLALQIEADRRTDPRWASWSLGTFICLRCSGVHRSLGTHISKARPHLLTAA